MDVKYIYLYMYILLHSTAHREFDHTLDIKTKHNIWDEDINLYPHSVACINCADIGCRM